MRHANRQNIIFGINIAMHFTSPISCMFSSFILLATNYDNNSVYIIFDNYKYELLRFFMDDLSFSSFLSLVWVSVTFGWHWGPVDLCAAPLSSCSRCTGSRTFCRPCQSRWILCAEWRRLAASWVPWSSRGAWSGGQLCYTRVICELGAHFQKNYPDQRSLKYKLLI